MKQLFLKSNLLHIRTNEGEFVVINPGTIPNSVFPCGWSGGVEIIEMCGGRENKYDADGCSACHGLCPEVNKLARLLPKEEFKPAQPTPNFPKGGTTFTESAYKEGEMCPDCGYSIEDARINMDHHLCKNKDFFKTKPVESSEPQEKMSYWQYQQFAEAAITQLKDRNETLESENKALREENTKCKELSWEAANEISRLKKEIERLKADLKNANSALDNISDMGHA